MKNLGWIGLLFVSLGCDALSFEGGLFPTENNARNCVIHPSACGPDQICDPVRKTCVSGSGTCATAGSCIFENAAFCNMGRCVGCDAQSASTVLGDQRCAEWAAQRGVKRKGLCIGGVCQECRTNADCKQPGKSFCDQLRNTCVGCMEDNQCPISNICKKDDSSLAINDNNGNIGDCVTPDAIAYVNKESGSCSDGAIDAGTSSKPFCQIKQAILRGKSYIRVLRGMEYEAIVVEQSNRVIIYGPGRTIASLVAAQVTTGGRLTLQDLAVSPASANSSTVPLIQCDMGSYLTVRRCVLNAQGHSFGGIIATNCPRVIIERSKIELINGNGVFITQGQNHFVVNNAIVRSGSPFFTMADRFGLRIGQGVTNSTFAFNTVTANREGALCETTATGITDSIVQGNMGPQQITGCATMTNVVTSGAVIDTTPGNDPIVTMDTANVVNKATPNPLVKDDYFGNPRPMGDGFDIGFHEYK